ncbi:hypothetical protein SCOR_31800 [Sulfidibacter corallicola]
MSTTLEPFAPPKTMMGPSKKKSKKKKTNGKPRFFSVGLVKLTVLSLVTFNFYFFYWFFKHFQHLKKRGGSVNPIFGAFFHPLFCFSLFHDVRERAARHGKPMPGPSYCWALLFVGLWLGNRVLDANGDVFGFIVFDLLRLVPVLVVQHSANMINQHEVPDHPANRRFTWQNWIWMGLGLLLWAMILGGTIIQLMQ